MKGSWVVEPLTKAHLRDDFDCGSPELDEYLRKFARQNHDSGVARTFVAVGDGGKVLGYYSLAAGSLSKENLPRNQEKRLPKFPLPILRLARLAVTREEQGKGLGEYLLMDALHRCLLVSEEVGFIAVVIDAKDEVAKNFYQRYDFDTLPGQPLTLWLPRSALMCFFAE